MKDDTFTGGKNHWRYQACLRKRRLRLPWVRQQWRWPRRMEATATGSTGRCSGPAKPDVSDGCFPSPRSLRSLHPAAAWLIPGGVDSKGTGPQQKERFVYGALFLSIITTFSGWPYGVVAILFVAFLIIPLVAWLSQVFGWQGDSFDLSDPKTARAPQCQPVALALW